jgi:arylsulfatase A-like enzyme
MPRTVDIYPTILELYGMQPPNRIRWEIPRLGGLLGSYGAEAEMRTDIDGQALDIWKQ